MRPIDTDGENTMELKISKDLFPYRDRLEELTIGEITLIADSLETGTYEISLITPTGSVNELSLTSGTFGNLLSNSELTDITIDLNSSEEILWHLSISKSGGERINENELKDMFMILAYRRS